MPEKDNEIKSEYSDLFRNYDSAWARFMVEARLDMEMHFGAHYTAQQLRQARDDKRTLYPFNKTARQVELIAGYETRNRHILKIGPQGKEDDFAANQHTEIIMQQMAFASGYDWISDAFKFGSLISGSNLLQLYNDRDGIRRFTRLGYN